MSEDEKTVAVPSLDPRAAEVLRFLDRAKGTIAKAQPNLTIEATAESLDATVRALERVVAMARERLTDFQRGQDGAVRELRVSVDGLAYQTAADPREPDKGTGCEGCEAPMSVDQPPRHRQ